MREYTYDKNGHTDYIYNDNRHPVHYVFLVAEMSSLKDKERLKDHISKMNNDIMIRTTGPKTRVEFMCSEYKLKDLINYCFKHIQEFQCNYGVIGYELDLTKL